MTGSGRLFQIGDQVQVGAQVGLTVWTVIGDDTNQTPVHDPEPAYVLRTRSRASGVQTIRYAYESALRRAATPAEALAAYFREDKALPERAGAASIAA